MKMFKLSILILLFLIGACNLNKKEATFYIVNNSRITKDVKINIVIDTGLVVNQIFSYSGVTPDYATFIKNYEKGIYKVKVKAGTLIKEDTFNLNRDIYIYISYDAALKENGDTSKGLTIYKTYVNHTHY